jgi:mevalonate kinase
MTTQRTSNGVPNRHNGFRSDSEPESPGSDSSDSVVNVNGITNGTSSLRINTRRKMNRKKSSPMMPAFIVSAPGKVIVFGEHAVVHGKVSALAEEADGRNWVLTGRS